ncbi:egl nine homolog 1-like [Pectinophora gossypiella]|uniref:egl nine homolog 1-like n=1 Tax=Pectinophora gossypiella TaxID=13191 RepID=UPI00214E08BB|nr:egl nine homolog 1-like [Pectinophora gossypiella]
MCDTAPPNNEPPCAALPSVAPAGDVPPGAEPRRVRVRGASRRGASAAVPPSAAQAPAAPPPAAPPGGALRGPGKVATALPDNVAPQKDFVPRLTKKTVVNDLTNNEEKSLEGNEIEVAQLLELGTDTGDNIDTTFVTMRKHSRLDIEEKEKEMEHDEDEN